MTKNVTPQQLREWILDDDELALLDVREEGVFGAAGHLLFAVCVPLSHLEIDILERVPRKSVRIWLLFGPSFSRSAIPSLAATWIKRGVR